MGEECKCDFYLAGIGEGNNIATRVYNTNECMRGFCTSKKPPCNGDMADRTYRVNNKITIPFGCWLGMLRED